MCHKAHLVFQRFGGLSDWSRERALCEADFNLSTLTFLGGPHLVGSLSKYVAASDCTKSI